MVPHSVAHSSLKKPTPLKISAGAATREKSPVNCFSTLEEVVLEISYTDKKL